MIMFRLASNHWVILAICAALAACGTYLRVSGYNAGYAASQTKNEADTRDLNDKLAAADEKARMVAAEAARLATELTDLERRLADEAIQDPGAGDAGLGNGSLQRLDSIR